jgi:hypothetical protein
MNELINFYTTRFPQLSVSNQLHAKITLCKLHDFYYFEFCYTVGLYEPTPVAARSKAWVFGRSLAVFEGSNTARGMDVCLLWVLCVVR